MTMAVRTSLREFSRIVFWLYIRSFSMKVRFAKLLALVACIAVVTAVSMAEDLKSGPEKKVGGPFDVKAITGDQQGKTLCYFCKYSGEGRPAVVMIFSQKADDNDASVVKAVDQVQKGNAKLGTVLVGIGGVEAADLEKLQTTHKLT